MVEGLQTGTNWLQEYQSIHRAIAPCKKPSAFVSIRTSMELIVLQLHQLDDGAKLAHEAASSGDERIANTRANSTKRDSKCRVGTKIGGLGISETAVLAFILHPKLPGAA